MKRPYTCKGCGGAGHNRQRCPSTSRGPAGRFTTEAVVAALTATNGHLRNAAAILGCTGERVRQIVVARGLGDVVLAGREVRKKASAEAQAARLELRRPEIAKAARDRAARNRAAGLCNCGRARAVGRSICETCHVNGAASQKRVYAERVKQGRCVRCPNLTTKTRTCRTCLDKLATYGKRGAK